MGILIGLVFLVAAFIVPALAHVEDSVYPTDGQKQIHEDPGSLV